MPLILRGRLAWAHDWISNPALAAAFQTLPGTSFIVNGAAPPKDNALATASAELRMTANWSLLGKFDGEYGQRRADLRRHWNAALYVVSVTTHDVAF